MSKAPEKNHQTAKVQFIYGYTPLFFHKHSTQLHFCRPSDSEWVNHDLPNAFLHLNPAKQHKQTQKSPKASLRPPPDFRLAPTWLPL